MLVKKIFAICAVITVGVSGAALADAGGIPNANSGLHMGASTSWEGSNPTPGALAQAIRDSAARDAQGINNMAQLVDYVDKVGSNVGEFLHTYQDGFTPPGQE